MLSNRLSRQSQTALLGKYTMCEGRFSRRVGLLTSSVAVGALLITAPQSAYGEAVVNAPSTGTCTVGVAATCSGDISEGIDADDSGVPTLETLNVNGVIDTTGAGNGIDFQKSIAGDLAITATENITTDNGHGIIAEQSGGGGTVTVTSTGDITVDSQAAISRTSGIRAIQSGGLGDAIVNSTGNITVEATNTSEPDGNAGIFASTNTGDGNVDITSKGDLDISSGEGIYGHVDGVNGDVDITTEGNIAVVGNAEGILADIENGDGDITIDTTGNITTFSGIAIEADHVGGDGNVNIKSVGNITSTGNGYGVLARTDLTTGDVIISSTGNITIEGASSGEAASHAGVYVIKGNSDGDIKVTSVGDIKTTGFDTAGFNLRRNGTGDTVLSSTGDIETDSFGIITEHSGTSGNTMITSEGDITVNDLTGTTAPSNIGDADAINVQSYSSGTVQSQSSGTATVNLKGESTLKGGTGVAAAVNFDSTTGGTGVLNTSGTITLSSHGSNAVVGGDGNETINNSGTLKIIAGNKIDLGSGSDAFNNLSGGVFDVTGDIDNIEAFSNAGTFGIASGQALTTTTFTQTGGTLTVNGTLTAATNINGGTLGGTGSIGNIIVGSGGILAPGNSIGTINTGDVTLNSGSKFNVELDNNGTSDLLNSSGTVTINSGATLNVVSTNNTNTTDTYTVITGATAVAGTFDTVTDTFVFLDAVLSYDANNVYLKLQQAVAALSTLAQTPNQLASSGAVDGLGAGNDIYDAFSVLTSNEDVRAAFDHLSGEAYASLIAILIGQGSKSRSIVSSRINNAFANSSSASAYDLQDRKSGYGYTGSSSLDTGSEFWIEAIGSWGSQSTNDNFFATSHDTKGFFVGADTYADATWLSNDWRFGVIGGFNQVSVDVPDLSSYAAVQSYTLGAYGGTQLGGFGLSFGGDYTWHSIDSTRNVTIGALANTLTANYNASTAQIYAELNYGYELGFGNLEPFANIAYVHHHTGAFAETGGAATLNAASNEHNNTFATLGVRGDAQIDDNIKVNGMLGLRHVFGDTTPNAQFTLGSSNAFTVGGNSIARDSLLVGAGFGVQISKKASLDFNYNGEYSSNAIEHSAEARFSLKF